MHEVSTSRREVMRALVIAPSIIATPTAASAAAGFVCAAPHRDAWDATMAMWLAYTAKGDAFDAQHVDPIHAEEKARFGHACPAAWEPQFQAVREWRETKNYLALCEQSEAIWNDAADAHTELLRMPAPDLSALRWKLDETFADDEIALWSDDIADAIRADITRLMPKGA